MAKLSGIGFGMVTKRFVSGCASRNCAIGVGCGIARLARRPGPQQAEEILRRLRDGKTGTLMHIRSVSVPSGRWKVKARPRTAEEGAVSATSGTPPASE